MQGGLALSVQLLVAQRAEWLTRPEAGKMLGAGAAALRELADRAQIQDSPTTEELPAVDWPVAPGVAR